MKQDSQTGIFSPDGKVEEITVEQMNIHNKILSEAELKGLDENCQIGQMGTLYFIKGQVQTFMGIIVSDKVHLSPSKKGITFIRNGKQFRGRLQKDADCFNFKRIS